MCSERRPRTHGFDFVFGKQLRLLNAKLLPADVDSTLPQFTFLVARN